MYVYIYIYINAYIMNYVSIANIKLWATNSAGYPHGNHCQATQASSRHAKLASPVPNSVWV